MNIAEVSQQLASMLNKASSMFLAANDDFAQQLSMGQILKGKVLRSYDGGRYLMEFGGQQKVVDSSVPLKTGELIHGRVVGLGDKVELKRLVLSDDASPEQQAQTAQPGNFLSSKWDALLLDAMQKFQVRFTAQERSAIISQMKKAQQPQLVMMSAMALSKQHIPISEQLLQLLSELQARKQNLSLLPADQLAPQLAAAESTVSGHAGSLSLLVNALMKLMQEQQDMAAQLAPQPPVATDTGEQQAATGDELNSEHNDQFAFNWRLLNTQIDGSVQHRVHTLPIWLGDRLVEVNIAIYEQRQQHGSQAKLSFRKIIFSLQLDTLGQLDIEMAMENKHLRLNVSADSHEATQHLLEHAHELNEELNDSGWALDEIGYATRSRDEMGHVAASVIEHYLAQDSLSRLM